MSATPETHWVCACVRRTKGKLQIKLNPISRARCGKCGCVRSEKIRRLRRLWHDERVMDDQANNTTETSPQHPATVTQNPPAPRSFSFLRQQLDGIAAQSAPEIERTPVYIQVEGKRVQISEVKLQEDGTILLS